MKTEQKRICLNQSVLDFMESKLTPESFVLEYGSGWSSRWCAEHCGKLISIETDPRWWTKVQNDVHGADCELQLRLTKNVVRVCEDIRPGSVDLILIDCKESFRHDATLCAWPLLKTGGWVLFDDAQRLQHAESIFWLRKVGGKPIKLEWQNGDVMSAQNRMTLAWQKTLCWS